MNKDYYKVLGLSRDASDDEIRKAYRRLALECHPDHHPADPDREERFKLVSEAYSVLGDAEKRLTYDLGFHRKGTRHSQADPESMFWQFVESEGFDARKASCLGGIKGCGRRTQGIDRAAVAGEHQIFEVVLTPAEAASGSQKKIVIAGRGFPRTYTFRTPAGVTSGTQFTLVIDRNTGLSVLLRIKIGEHLGAHSSPWSPGLKNET
jgi:molecular chaperone DnaJ